jgi:hypothetical protein
MFLNFCTSKCNILASKKVQLQKKSSASENARYLQEETPYPYVG